MDRPLSTQLRLALRAGSGALAPMERAEPVDERDRLLTLLTIHDLHLAPLDRLGARARLQHHPVIAELKGRLEGEELRRLDAPAAERQDAAGEVRRIARYEQVPEVYEWVAEEASFGELVEFLSLEGGPDAGFDDLVALCQVGLAGEPKLELARNYWDEMGRGHLDAIHAELHHDLCAAIDMPAVPRQEQPTSGLRRAALGSILATNRCLQPELVGALGLTELQAGPRCRKVVRGLRRLDAPAAALPFYVEHAEVDPHHGKAWMDRVVAPLAEDDSWAEGIVRGAGWRAQVNSEFFEDMARRFSPARRRRSA